jgi:hypothetical protein
MVTPVPILLVGSIIIRPTPTMKLPKTKSTTSIMAHSHKGVRARHGAVVFSRWLRIRRYTKCSTIMAVRIPVPK